MIPGAGISGGFRLCFRTVFSICLLGFVFRLILFFQKSILVGGIAFFIIRKLCLLIFQEFIYVDHIILGFFFPGIRFFLFRLFAFLTLFLEFVLFRRLFHGFSVLRGFLCLFGKFILFGFLFHIEIRGDFIRIEFSAPDSGNISDVGTFVFPYDGLYELMRDLGDILGSLRHDGGLRIRGSGRNDGSSRDRSDSHHRGLHGPGLEAFCSVLCLFSLLRSASCRIFCGFITGRLLCLVQVLLYLLKSLPRCSSELGPHIIKFFILTEFLFRISIV